MVTDEQLEGLFEAVVDEATLLIFIEAMSRSSIENQRTSDFLEAAAGYGQDTVTRHGLGDNPWRRFADLLMGGAIYD